MSGFRIRSSLPNDPKHTVARERIKLWYPGNDCLDLSLNYPHVPARATRTAHSPGRTPFISPARLTDRPTATGLPVAFITSVAHSACSAYLNSWKINSGKLSHEQGGEFPYMGYLGIFGLKEYAFLAVLAKNRISILAILDWNRVWF